MNLLGVLLPDCREMARTSSRRLDGALPVAHRVGRAIHLAFCRHCRRYRRHIDWVRRAALASRDRTDPSTRPSHDFRERLKNRLCNDDATAGSRGEPPEFPSRATPRNSGPTENTNE